MDNNSMLWFTSFLTLCFYFFIKFVNFFRTGNHLYVNYVCMRKYKFISKNNKYYFIYLLGGGIILFRCDSLFIVVWQESSFFFYTLGCVHIAWQFSCINLLDEWPFGGRTLPLSFWKHWKCLPGEHVPYFPVYKSTCFS